MYSNTASCKSSQRLHSQLTIRPQLVLTPRLGGQIRQSSRILAAPPPAHGPRSRNLDPLGPGIVPRSVLLHLIARLDGLIYASDGSHPLARQAITHATRARNPRTVLQRLQQRDRRLGRQILIVIVIDLHHRRIDTGAQTLDLHEREQPVLGRLSGVDVEIVLDGLDDGVAATAAQHAGRGGADLQVELADRVPVVHGVEGGHLVDAHGRHLQQARHLVHHRDGGEAVLALAEVEQRHHGGFFVLRWVAFEDLRDDGLVLRVEFEGDARVVFGCVAVLFMSCVRDWDTPSGAGRMEWERTTKRVSL